MKETQYLIKSITNNNEQSIKIKKDDIHEYKPTSKEGKIVCISDLLVSIFECLIFEARYAACVYFLFIFNLIRY